LAAQPVSEATAALQQRDFAAAERLLRAEVLAKPNDAWTLSLLGYSLDNQKHGAEAEEFHRRALALSPHAAEILNNYGGHLWMMERYGEAETAFAEALAAAPTYFNALYNLGLMATYAGHYDRAIEVLRGALRQQPKNVEVLYRLASAEESSHRWEDAAMHLSQASRLDAKRADVQKLLAVTTAELGALSDSAAAWDRYLALEPTDDVARRERAYTAVKLGKLEEGAAALRSYVERHTDDKVGHYELGQAERDLDAAVASQEFGKALAIDGSYGAARAARGALRYQNAEFEAALPDLEAAASLNPWDAATLDRLGQTYQALDRAADAVQVLRKAAEAAPDDPKIVLHLGRALADAGQMDESKAMIARFRASGPEKKAVVPEGLVDYLSLTSEQRRADYRARLEKGIREHPDDIAALVEYLKVLIEVRDQSAAEVARRIVALRPDRRVLADVGNELLLANNPSLARDMLQGGPASLSLALATYLAAPASARAALELMDKVAQSERGADYWIARAQMLASVHESPAAACERAVRILSDATRVQPENRGVLLMHSIALEFAGRTSDATSQLREMRRRWPEWPAAWSADGIVHATHQRYSEAVRSLEAAVALGADDAETNFFLAKAYDLLGRQSDAREARARIGTVQTEAFWLGRFFRGSWISAGEGHR
jgi:tetratricopeptide (TPR) repeat protein